MGVLYFFQLKLMTVAPEQNQRIYLYQKQTGPHCSKHYWREAGLNIQVPQKAKTGTYLDKKCPFTSDVSIRGRLMFAEVYSTKMQNTIICRKSYLHYDKKYKRFEKRHKNIPAQKRRPCHNWRMPTSLKNHLIQCFGCAQRLEE